MYLLLERPGVAPQRIKVDDDVVLVGRAPTCDVVIDEEFVSKQHLRILRGLVAVDMSSNGTFIDGERIVGGVVLNNQPMRLACSEITLRVEEESVPPPAARSGAPDTKAATDEGPAIAVLRRELQGMSKQLKTKSETCKELAAKAEKAQEHAEKAQEDAEKARQEAEALRADNAALRAKVEELARREPEVAAPEAPADGSAASLLLFKLQRENAQLKRALADKESAPGASAVVPPPVASVAPPAVAAPPAAASPPPTKAQPPAGQPTPTSPQPATDRIVPLARDAIAAPSSDTARAFSTLAAGGSAGGLALLRLSALVKQDAEAMECRTEDPLDAFLMVEGFRFLRRLERVITRMAGGLIQLYQLHTMVPGIEGNLRELLAAALADPGRASGRQELLDYLKELGRWAVVALSAYRKAAEGFALQLRDELSVESLTAEDGIPVVKRMSGKTEAELWRRATAHLRTLGPDRITERIEKLARDAANELAERDEATAF